MRVGADDVVVNWSATNGSLSVVGLVDGTPRFANPVSFEARAGKLNEGFDPPQAGDLFLEQPSGDAVKDEDHWEWWTSVAKAGPDALNTKVKVVFETVETARLYELIVEEDSRNLISISANPAQPIPITAKETDLVIFGLAGDDAVRNATILARPKNGLGQGAKLRVKVLPRRDPVLCKFYVVPIAGDPQSNPYPSASSADIASVGETLAEIDSRFTQAVVGANSDRTDFTSNPLAYDLNNNGELDGNDELDFFDARAGQFTGECNILYVDSLGVSEGELGMYDPVGNRIYIGTSAWTIGAGQQETEDAEGASYDMARVIAHEFGHYLDLSTRRNATRENHDDWVVPKTTAALMRNGRRGPPGKWMRHEDWHRANDRVKEWRQPAQHP
jgi:hypothetical protein